MQHAYEIQHLQLISNGTIYEHSMQYVCVCACLCTCVRVSVYVCACVSVCVRTILVYHIYVACNKINPSLLHHISSELRAKCWMYIRIIMYMYNFYIIILWASFRAYTYVWYSCHGYKHIRNMVRNTHVIAPLTNIVQIRCRRTH